MKIQNIKNGKIIKIGSIVKISGEKYYVYKLKSDGKLNIGLEIVNKRYYRCYDFVEPKSIGCRILKS